MFNVFSFSYLVYYTFFYNIALTMCDLSLPIHIIIFHVQFTRFMNTLLLFQLLLQIMMHVAIICEQMHTKRANGYITAEYICENTLL